MKLILSFFVIFILNFCLSLNIYGNELKEGVLRTPDDRFENLKDYPFKPNYMVIDGLRIHYLDEGPKDADPILLLHGEPAWSYLFRKMIPVLTAQGHRVIVPDCVGFGKSDKFISKYDYSYKHHIDVMKELVETLDLKECYFFWSRLGRSSRFESRLQNYLIVLVT
jgi:haloalkane dehalogenase